MSIDFVNLLVGALLGVLTTVFFQKPLERWWHSVLRRYAWYRSRFRSDRPTGEFFSIGQIFIKWHVLEGSLDQPYKTGAIKAFVGREDLSLPTEIARRRDEIASLQQDREKRPGHHSFHDGPMVALSDFKIARNINKEEPLLTLNFLRTSYYAFMATSLRIDDPIETEDGNKSTLRELYLRNTTYDRPNPLLATSFAVNLAVLTADNYLLYGKRGHNGITNYASSFTVPVNECVNPDKDNDERGDVDIWKTAIRGAKEELGIEVTADEIEFFTLGVDPALYFYGLTGVIRLKEYTRDGIFNRRSTGETRDRMELESLFALKIEAKASNVFDHTGGMRVWHPAGAVALLQALIKEVGAKQIEKALK